jgi:hypothetical protein
MNNSMPISPEGTSGAAIQQVQESATRLLRADTTRSDQWLLEVIDFCKQVIEARSFTGRPQEQELKDFVAEYETHDFNAASINASDTAKANYVLTRIAHPVPEIRS